jgi:broad specificity phosphatase PhoE
MVTQIFLIRHGETAWSLTGQHTGRTDLPLTETGEHRASQLRGLLQEIKFTHVLTSPLQRARRTCELAGFGAVARVEPDLHELDYGDYEGRTTADIRSQHPGWSMFTDGSPHGESVEKFSERADRVLAVLDSMDGAIALFSHGQFLRALAARWIRLPVQDGQHFALDTASISILGYEHTNEETPAILLWNVVSNAILPFHPQ